MVCILKPHMDSQPSPVLWADIQHSVCGFNIIGGKTRQMHSFFSSFL